MDIDPGGGLSIAFQPRGEVTKEQVDEAQPELKGQAAAIEERIKAEASPTAPTDVDVSGTWQGANGLMSMFDQYGDRVSLQELSPYGITAVGDGIVLGDTVSGSFTAVDGTRGGFRLVNRGDTLQGSFTNYYGQFPASMERIS